MRAAKRRAEAEKISARAVPTAKAFDLDLFVSRQDAHVHEKRANLAAKRASRQEEEAAGAAGRKFIPLINTKSREMAAGSASGSEAGLISRERLLKPTASSEQKRYKGPGDTQV